MTVRSPRPSRPVPRAPSARPVSVRRHPAAPRDSRTSILDAATTEFALRGFAAAGVDRIATRARLNKAMIYYHFHNKQDLYQNVLRQLFGAICDRLEGIASTADAPRAKIDRFVDVLVREGEHYPHFAPIVLREIAEGGRRLDDQTYTLLLRLSGVMRRILDEGHASGEFAPVDPILFHLTTVWPIVLYLATGPIRASIARVAHVDAARLGQEPFIRHMQTINQKALAPCPASPDRKGRARQLRATTEKTHE